MKHIKTPVLLLLLMALTQSIYTQWVDKSLGKPYNIRSISFVSADSGYVGGDSVVLQTNNGSSSWKEMRFQYKINTVNFPSYNIGYAGGDIVMRTTNAGEIWDSVFKFESLSSGEAVEALSLAFSDASTGIVVAEAWKPPYYTTSMGNIWNLPEYRPLQYVAGLSMPSSKVAYIAAFGSGFISFSELFKTTDGGRTWYIVLSESIQPYIPFWYSTAIYFIVSSHKLIPFLIYDFTGLTAAPVTN